MSISRLNQNEKYIFFISLIVIFIFVIWGSDFRFADGNNGRYLPTLYRVMDPELFPSDPVVDAFGRFESLFYSGLGWIMKFFNVSILDVETVFYSLFVLSRIVLVALLFALTAKLNQDPWTFILLAAWSIHSKSASVSGDSMFEPAFTHATIAFLLGIAALMFFLRGWRKGFGLILGLSLFFHSIITLHLALMMFPILIWQSHGKFSRNELIGMLIFAGAFIIYLLWMTPPVFTPLEASLFLQVKGEMGHISPLAHPITSWVSVAGKVLLAFTAWRLFLHESKSFTSLMAAMLIGSGLALSLGFAAILTGNLLLTQLQPLRMFEWVNFMAFLLIIGSVPIAWKKDRWLSVLIIANIALNILTSLWGLAWIWFGVVVFTLYGFQTKYNKIHREVLFGFIKAGMIFLAIAAFLMLVLKDFHSFESFRDPLPVLILILIVVVPFLPLKAKFLQYAYFTTIMTLVLLGRSFALYDYINERENADFDATCLWIAKNTKIDTQFVTAVHEGGNFRARSIRTSLNESQSALYWVAPLVAQQNGQDAAKVMSAWDGEAWDMNVLFSIAEEWNADYILIEVNLPIDVAYQYQQGDYYLLAVH